jgi:hypothetical protein
MALAVGVGPSHPGNFAPLSNQKGCWGHDLIIPMMNILGIALMKPGGCNFEITQGVENTG